MLFGGFAELFAGLVEKLRVFFYNSMHSVVAFLENGRGLYVVEGRFVNTSMAAIGFPQIAQIYADEVRI